MKEALLQRPYNALALSTLADVSALTRRQWPLYCAPPRVSQRNAAPHAGFKRKRALGAIG